MDVPLQSESWTLKASGAIAYRAAPFDPRTDEAAPPPRKSAAVWLAACLAVAVTISAGLHFQAAQAGSKVVATKAPTVAKAELTYVALPKNPRTQLPGAPGPAALQTRLDELAANYREPVGVAVADVTSGWIASVDGDTPYPQQSVSKLWVVLSVFDRIDQGQINMQTPVFMGPEDRSVFFQPISAKIGESGFTTDVNDLVRRALIDSDNAANDRLIKQVGGVTTVTDVLTRKLLNGIALGAPEHEQQARTAGLMWRPEYGRGNAFKEARAKLPDGIRDIALKAYLDAPPDGASPIGIVRALAALKRGELLSPASTEAMISIMGEARTGPRRLRGGLPEGWTISHKTGTGPDWKTGSVGINDVGLITAPDGRTYAVAVMMKQTRQGIPARLAFMQAVTRAIVAQWEAERAPRLQYAKGETLRPVHSRAAD